MPRSIGLLVNPVAGVGGPAGLKGSDGAGVQATAFERGSALHSGERGIRALATLAASHPGTSVITASGAMGADAVGAAGLTARVVYAAPTPSTAADTTAAAAAIMAAGAELLLFVGGDGTARDVAAGLTAEQPMLGVPAGVKMYSGCFAVSPSAAGALAARWLADQPVPLERREVLDVDEEQIRHGRVDPRLFALVHVPFIAGRTQSRKSATPATEAAAVRAAAAGAVAAMDYTSFYLLGPGGTTMEIARQLGVPKTPLGVDVVRGGELVLADASEQQLLAILAAPAASSAPASPAASTSPRVRAKGRLDPSPGGHLTALARPKRADANAPARAVITVIGGQGFLLGRGNQQISAAVLRALGAHPLLVVATEEKLTDLGGRPLLVDTGDPALDHSLAGYTRVITGVHTVAVYPVSAPEPEPVPQPEPRNEGAQPCV